ncbi:MAG TPA: peptidoglycan DD-metalloendopeptidase family protein [candidate division Zixibacteria bacterium]|nr:peptidoglycan DD-metalloendopeptidase family protein [candidate division Zixibacteria bacterium]
MVIGLVAATAAFGISTGGSDGQPQGLGPEQTLLRLDLVAQARGAAGEAPPDRTVTFELQPDPLASDPMLSRRQPRVTPTPLPTPVAPPSPTPEPRVVAAARRPAAPVIGSGSLAWPVAGGSISQYYNAGHRALDIAAPSGTAVSAADAGVVTFAGWRNNGGGYVVIIDHGNGIVTAYNHLSAISVGVGRAVARGERIAAIGCTGICTGPHLHFEVFVGGVAVNPLRYL